MNRCCVRFFILLFPHLRCVCTKKMGSIGFRYHTSNYVVGERRLRSATAALLHHHAQYRLATERKRRLPWLIRLHLELLVLAHHIEEPVVGRRKSPQTVP